MGVKPYDPTFIIKCGNKYYVTNAVAAYDPDDLSTELDEEADVRAVAETFDQLDRGISAPEKCVALRVPKSINLLARQATNKKRSIGT